MKQNSSLWLLAGTLPDSTMPLEYGQYDCDGTHLLLPSGKRVSIVRGTAALAGATARLCRLWGLPLPQILLGGDEGKGNGSREVYACLETHLATIKPQGITFHYLFPDVDGHNRVLMALQALQPSPLTVADAGFMYVAKMSGYASNYTIFTPDAGEMAFLADENAPHPFYTRGFLLGNESTLPALLSRAHSHGNSAQYVLLKGSSDYIAHAGEIRHCVHEPSVPAMECIGGTGDLITAFVTAFLMRGDAPEQACLHAAQLNRLLAAIAQPTPATQVGELLTALPEALQRLESEKAS